MGWTGLALGPQTIMVSVGFHLTVPQLWSNCRVPILSANRLFVTQSGLILRKMYMNQRRRSRLFRAMNCAKWIEIFSFSLGTNDGTRRHDAAARDAFGSLS
jgi:hypothetical protein